MIACPQCQAPISTRQAFSTPIRSTTQCANCGAILRPTQETMRNLEKVWGRWGSIAGIVFVISTLILLWGTETWWHWLVILVINLLIIAWYGITSFRAFDKVVKFEIAQNEGQGNVGPTP